MKTQDVFCTTSDVERRSTIQKRLNATCLSSIDIKLGMNVILSSARNGLPPGSKGTIIKLQTNHVERFIEGVTVSFSNNDSLLVKRKEIRVLSYDGSLLAFRL